MMPWLPQIRRPCGVIRPGGSWQMRNGGWGRRMTAFLHAVPKGKHISLAILLPRSHRSGRGLIASTVPTGRGGCCRTLVVDQACTDGSMLS